MHTGLPDNEIIHRVLRGEQQAYADLVKRYQNYVFTLTLRYISSREDAEEVAQDVFVKAYRFLGDFRGETAKFSTWLYTITQTTCLSYLRKKKVNIDSIDEEKTMRKAENVESPDAASRMEQRSRAGIVQEAMKMLAPADAEVLTLFYQAEQSLEEMGRILGLDPNTAKVRLHRARQRLKEKLEKNFSNELKELV